MKSLRRSPVLTQLHRWSNKKNVLSLAALRTANGEEFFPANIKESWLIEFMGSAKKTDNTNGLKLPKDFLLGLTAVRKEEHIDVRGTRKVVIVPLELSSDKNSRALWSRPGLVYVGCNSRALQNYGRQIEKAQGNGHRLSRLAEQFVGRRVVVDEVEWGCNVKGVEEALARKLKGEMADNNVIGDGSEPRMVPVKFTYKNSHESGISVVNQQVIVNFNESKGIQKDKAEKVKETIEGVTKDGVLVVDHYKFMKNFLRYWCF